METDSVPQQTALPAFHKNLARAIRRDYYDDADPSTRAFLRAYAFGYLAETGPAFVRLLLSTIITSRRFGLFHSFKGFPRRLLTILKRALGTDGLALFFGVGLGGAKYLERIIYQALVKVYAVRARNIRAKATPSQDEESALKEPLDLSPEQKLKRERVLHQASTFLATTLSAFFAFGLQNKNGGATQGTPYAASSLPLVSLPRAEQEDARHVHSTNSLQGQIAPNQRYESATMDLTLFLLVRATDTLLRAMYEKTSMGKNKVAQFLADRGDTLLFVLASWRIMWVWFYKPWLLPPSYDK